MEQMRPRFKDEIKGQGAQVVEEGHAGAYLLANLRIDGLGEVKHGVHQKGQELEDEQQPGKILLAMPKVMGEMIAVIFERVVVLVLGFPTGACGTDDRGHILVGDGMVGDESVALAQFTSLFIDDNDFTPVDPQGILARRHQRVNLPQNKQPTASGKIGSSSGRSWLSLGISYAAKRLWTLPPPRLLSMSR